MLMGRTLTAIHIACGLYQRHCGESHTNQDQCVFIHLPFITHEINALLREKDCWSENKEECNVSEEEDQRGKNSYRRKIEEQLPQNNISGVWRGLKTLSGSTEPSCRHMSSESE